MQTILGANGTIGKILAKELTNYTNEIRLVSRKPIKINPTDELYPADLSDIKVIDKAIAGSEIVYLVVGFEYKLSVWQKQWPQLMRAVIDSCIKHNAKLVFFDNMYLYSEESLMHMTEDAIINPSSKKGKVREQIASMLMDEVKTGKLKALIARSADFYGPENKSSLLIELVYNNLLKNKNPNWLMNTSKKHSFTYTPDAAKGTALLGNTPDAYNQVWHLPTDKNTLTGKEMIELFMKEMNTSKSITVLNRFMLRLLGIFIPVLREMVEMLYQYDRDYVFDSSKFEKRFNFTPTSYREGVKNVVGGM